MKLGMKPTEMADVWERVTRPSPEPEAPERRGEADFLGEAIENAGALDEIYEKLAKKLRNRQEGRMLRSFAAQVRGAQRELDRRFFILTGRNYFPRPYPAADTGLSAGLRLAVMREERLENQLSMAAAAAPDRWAGTFRRLANMAKRRARSIEELLRRLMR